MDALELIRDRIKWCETEGVDILCCPEAVLGGLADDVHVLRILQSMSTVVSWKRFSLLSQANR
jgi:hypothetical protein